MNKFPILAISIVVLILAGITFLPSGSGIKDVSPKEFDNIIQNGEVFVINTHTPYVGEIEGTDLIAENWENMGSYLNQLPEDKETPIAVYCRSGSMSSSAANQLSQLGFKKIYNLEGGMNSWQASGKELIFK